MQHNNSGSPQQFCLRWNNYQSNLTNVFDQLLQNESFVDVTLACDGHSVKAHKMVLSACSPYFQTLFFENPCQHPIVIMRDIKWPELKAAVEFMYKGEINVSQEQIGPLLKVAESLKIRGLADVNGEQDVVSQQGEILGKTVAKSSLGSGLEWEARQEGSIETGAARIKKRRRLSGERSSLSSPTGSAGAMDISEAPPSVEMSPAPPATPLSSSTTAPEPLPLTLPLAPQQTMTQGHSTINTSSGPVVPTDDMEIKPGIAEMIREEERAKLLESSHAWLGASTSSIAADSYQYQLQSMWQKCWNTNQSLVHNLRFRERGPLKSWRPETMAEAIFSVLKEGLSLSQAARKYDIPYPTFVLYANRVHNMLGPSADGGSDLRPKGRGRPQRILLGVWPDEHIKGVIRAVVFRDSHHIKDEPMGYPRIHDGVGIPASYPNNTCNNGSDPTVSPGAAAAAAVAAVAQGLRQQMCNMMAAAQQQQQQQQQTQQQQQQQQQNCVHDSLVNSLTLAAHCTASPLPMPPSLASNGATPTLSLGGHRMTSPSSVQDLRISPTGSALESPLSSPLGLSLVPPSSQHQQPPTPTMSMSGGNDVTGIGVSGMTYKPSVRPFTSPRPETLFQEDIDDLVKPMHAVATTPPLHHHHPHHHLPKDSMTATSIKIEPLTECRGE